jgi:hypothetical protein
VNFCCRVQTAPTARMHPLFCELCVFALNQRKQRLYVEPIHPKARHIPRKAARLRARCAGFRSSPRRSRRRPLGAPATGSAGFPAGYWERRLSSRPLGAPAFQPASPDAGSMPASGDLAAEAILHVPSRMFSADGFSSDLRVFAISHVFGTALSRAKDVPAGKPALPVAARVQGFSRFPTSLARH